MKTRKRLSSLLALVLTAALLTGSAFAATWYLEDGDITVSASENGQTVKQGDKNAVADNDVVITQRDGSTATDSTITISTTGDAEAEITIKDVNIRSDGDALDVGSSGANITLEGENKLFSESGSALYVSDGDVTITGSGSLAAEIAGDRYNGVYNYNAKIGSHEDEDMSGSIHITGSATVTMKDDRDGDALGNGAGIGSGDGGNMSGDITIDENAAVTAFSQEEGAGIGSGYNGNMSGTITVGGNAQVTAGSGNDGAGIGAGEDGDMSGKITIDGSTQVTAWSEGEGTGIGAGNGGQVSGTITIGGSAQVTAGSHDDGAGIGAGEHGSISSTGRIILRDNAKVTAIGEAYGTGIGAGEDTLMEGLIIIQDNAQITAIAGHSAAAIGSNNPNEVTGTILILGNARVATGKLLYNDDDYDYDDVFFDYDTNQIKYTLNKDAVGCIGDGDSNNHASGTGHYVLGPDVTINGLSGSDAEALKQYINMRLSGEDHDGEPENLTALDIRAENGRFTVTASGEGTVEKILYNGRETVPTAPGSYPVTVILDLSGETVEIEIGTIIVPESASKAEPGVYAPLYRITDADGKDISYEKALVDGVLTLTVKADDAKLVLRSGALDTLRAQGIEKIVFVTTDARSAFTTADAAALGSGELVLTHSGAEVSATLAGKALDTDKLLIKE